MRHDEVYQAALAAGSGGIRWNSVTKQIQLADENKNWVDWRYFNTDYEISHDLNSTSEGSQTFTLSKVGLYILTVAGHTTTTLTTNATTLATSPTLGSIIELLVYSDGTATATFNINNANLYGGTKYVIYIGNNYSQLAAPPTYSGFIREPYEQTVNTANTLVHFIMRGTTRYDRTCVTYNVENRNISSWDPQNQNRFSVACLLSNTDSSITVSGNGNTSSSDISGSLLTTYVLE